MTVPGVNPLACAALPGQKDPTVTDNAINIPSFVSFDHLTAMVSCQTQNGRGKRRPGLHQALHPFPTRNEWGADRGEGKPIKTHLLSPALSSIRWRRGLEFGFY